MKYKARRIAGGMILSAVLCSGTLAGCAASAQVEAKEFHMEEESCSLESWKKQLAKETKAGEIIPEAIRGLSVEKDGETAFAVSYEPETYKESFDSWEISVPYKSTVSVNTEALYELFETVSFLGWQEEEGMNWDNSGLSESDDLIFLAYDSNQRNGEKGQALPSEGMVLFFGGEDDAGHVYMGVEGNDQVYLADKTLTETVFGLEPYAYILRIPALVGIDTVLKVDIQAGKKTHCLEKEEGRWMLDGNVMDETAAGNYYGKLLDLLIQKELPGESSGGGDGERLLSIQFHRADTEAPDVKVEYEVYDEEYAKVRVNENAFFLVYRQDVEALIKGLE